MSEEYDINELYVITSVQDVARWLSDINENVRIGASNGGISLNEWEEGFIKSVSPGVKRGQKPSGKQILAIRKIWDRC